MGILRELIAEFVVEEAALDWLAAMCWLTTHASDIARGRHGNECADYGGVVLESRLGDA